jgi:hypothetical protein
MSLSFYVLLINIWAGILIVSILFITFWRNVHLPFLNSFALSRLKGHEGRYGIVYHEFQLGAASSKTGLTIIDMAIRQTGLSWAV